MKVFIENPKLSDTDDTAVYAYCQDGEMLTNFLSTFLGDSGWWVCDPRRDDTINPPHLIAKDVADSVVEALDWIGSVVLLDKQYNIRSSFMLDVLEHRLKKESGGKL